MRLRTIQAARMSDAIATLRAELGAEAVTVSYTHLTLPTKA